MMVRFVLANRFPHLLWWGPDYIQIYNDYYTPVLGTKHPAQAMGKPFRECWHEVYDVLGPLVDTPFNGGPPTWIEDLELIVKRHGFPEESHFTVAYSPVPDDTAPRGIGGVLATVHEITDKVISQRRVGILSELSARLAETRTDEEVCRAAIDILAKHPKDAPFALAYLLDEATGELRRAGTTGIAGALAGPLVTHLDSTANDLAWPLAHALQTETPQTIEDLSGVLPSVPPGPWPYPPHAAVVLPIRSLVAQRPAGALVVGISACIRYDSLYSGFLELAVSQIGTAIANARAYEEERRRAAALAELDRAKTVFFSNVSHEFRTPLTLMLGPLEDALASPELPESIRASLDVAQRNAQRLLKLVNSLLDVARIEAGRIQSSFAPVDLAALTADLSSTFRSAMERAGLTFDVRCEPIGEPVYVDREMWEKIVLNLLSNAFKYTLSGGVSVRAHRDGRDAALEISDTGVGVAEQHLPHLFDRFYRVEGSEARTHEGSGIGLALVQELVRLHGGSITVSSVVGQGTTFRVRIPLGTAHVPREQRGAPPLPSTGIASQTYVQEALRWLPDEPKTSPSADPSVRRPDHRFASTYHSRILLADDNADMRAYVRDLLGAHYDVELVIDGERALEAARRSRPDLILSDVMMPRLDGFGLLQALRADPSLQDIPVILLSARAGEESRIEGLGAGADDYIVKPFHAREFLARIGALLERHQTQKALKRQQHELEAADRHKNEFLAMLAHELRNPLAPIRNANELLLRQFVDNPGARATLGTISRQVTHLTRLVDDLLDISRITLGRIDLRRRPVTLGDIVGRAIETIDPLLRQKGLRVAVASSRQRLLVNADPERLVQCIGNILTNAVKYTDKPGEIRIETGEVAGEASVCVTDQGVGISSELLPRVFDLFVQGERTLDRSEGGLGVGLSIVRRIIEMHGGSVSVRSPGINKGATFEIRLPLAREAEASPGTRAAGAMPPSRILVVDDNADAAETLSSLLAMEGHSVQVAFAGPQALQSVESFCPQVVLLDIGLPGIDGYEVARRIRENHRQPIYLVALTGYGQDADRERARAAGFADHLVKPVEYARLQQTLAAFATTDSCRDT
jgi:signal transduction histidine kinase